MLGMAHIRTYLRIVTSRILYNSHLDYFWPVEALSCLDPTPNLNLCKMNTGLTEGLIQIKSE